MAATYRDIVFRGIGIYPLVWCEYKVRLHTMTELRYQVKAYEASEDGSGGYKKGAHVDDSTWKDTPQKARQGVEDEVGELKKDNILYEKWFGAPYSISLSKEF